jgi:hypothetical protein
MAFKDILLSLNTYPDPAPLAAVQFAVGLAKRLEARISCVIWELKLQRPGSVHFVADALLELPALLAAETKKSGSHAHGLARAFEQYATQEGVFGRCIVQSCAPVKISDNLSERARLHDLTIVPVIDFRFRPAGHAGAGERIRA